MDRTFIEIITAVIGSIGFAIYFNIEKSKISSVAIGGFLAWVMYIISFEITKNLFVSSFSGGLFACIYSEIMARVLKSPANIFLIPSIIPLLPGGSLYYTMSAALSRQMNIFKEKGFETIVIALGIASGIIVGFFIFIQIFKFINRDKAKA